MRYMVMSDESESPEAKLQRWSKMSALLVARCVFSGSWVITGGAVEPITGDRLVIVPDKGRVELSLVEATLELGAFGMGLDPLDCLTIHYPNGDYCNLINCNVDEEWPEFVDWPASPDVT
jgi:hypothetical protein